jgi:iron-regulated transporter 1
VYGETLVPLSLLGLSKTLAGMAFAGWIGDLVDLTPRLRFMQTAIGAEKVSTSMGPVFFSHLSKVGQLSSEGASLGGIVASWSFLVLTIVITCLLSLVMTGMRVAIQRDWVTVIAQGDERQLTRLNSYLRRIDLLGGIAAPVSGKPNIADLQLIVSSLTTSLGYPITYLILSGLTAASFFLEIWWIRVVYESFPELEEHGHRVALDGINRPTKGRAAGLSFEKAMWIEFSRLPIFWSEFVWRLS